MRAFFLLLVEIGGHVFHESRRQKRLDVDEAQLPAALGRQFQRLIEPLRARGGIGEIDGEDNPMEHCFLLKLGPAAIGGGAGDFHRPARRPLTMRRVKFRAAGRPRE